jgi:hypothetical protein
MPNRKSQARTKADSEQKVENIFVCQHRSKPNVSRSLFVHRQKVNGFDKKLKN